MATNTWILVADGARARVLRHDGRGGKLEPALDEEMTGMALGRQTRDLVSDQPGMTKDRAGQGMRRNDPPTEPQRHAKHEFARDVARMLADALNRGEYDRLVVCAPPRALGDLRQELSKNVQDRVVGEVNKDLVKSSDDEVREHVSAFLRP
jgi:protein required for attachment to host cells